MSYANNKDADQPAHLRSLICTFDVRCLDSIILLVSISEISSLCLGSVAAQASLSLTWSETPKTGFLVVWHIFIMIHEYLVDTGSTALILVRSYYDQYGTEPRHDKTNKMTVRLAKTQISLGVHPV